MTKKILTAFLVGAFVLAGIAAPYAQAAPGNGEPPDRGPAMLIQRLADDTGIAQEDLAKYVRQGVNPRDLMHAAMLSTISGKSLPDILSMKTLANTWQDVEQSLGITGDQIHARQQDMMAAKMATDLNIPKNTIVDLMQNGYNPQDISLAATLANTTHKSITDVLSMKKINNNWFDVAKSLGVDQESFKQSLAKLHCGLPGPDMKGPCPGPGEPGPGQPGPDMPNQPNR